MTHPHDHPVRAELQSLDQRRADTLADALRPDDAPTGDAHERRATLLRTVDTRGVTRDVLVTLVWSATDARPARQRVIYGRTEAVIDTDSEDPREAVCRWGNFCLAEIRGPGEATTAEQLAARDAALAAVDAVRADYAPRREPPTADEVRAVARLWEHRGSEYVPGAPFLAMRELGPGETVPIVIHLDAEHDEVSIVTEDGRGVHSEPLANALRVLASWCAIGPTGPVAWSELARLVEGVRSLDGDTARRGGA